jgi:NADH-quinone oxidoreductase subunit A
MLSSDISFALTVLLFLGGAGLFILLGLFTARLIRPNHPGIGKNAAYECGEEASGISGDWFNVRFYLVALIFVLFEVEIVFIFPWAIVLAEKNLMQQTAGAWGWMALGEMVVFMGILAVGLLYVWKKGYLNWSERTSLPPAEPILSSRYKDFNRKYQSTPTNQTTWNSQMPKKPVRED